jgi:hypothetical protein
LKHESQRGQPSDDADGVRIEHRHRPSVLPRLSVMVAVAAAAFTVWVLVGRSDRAGPRARTAPIASAPSNGVRAAAPRWPDAPVRVRGAHVVARRRAEPAVPVEAEGEPSAAPKAPAARPEIDAADYIDVLRADGETAGLAAFPPPGTNPPRSGVVVPEEYDLPEGFARHHQTTDDGKRLAPVLVLAPEYDLIDEAGERVDLGGDRIVPPEFAPPDLPVEMLEIPLERERDSAVR